MRGNKTAVWRNALGQEIVFDNRTFFLESIDMTGTAGIHTAESLAMTDGQVTLDHHLGAKTIPCSFAWKDVKDDRWMQAYLTSLFNPTVSGTLTVYTREETYQIDCYPQDFPVFQRDSGVCMAVECRLCGGLSLLAQGYTAGAYADERTIHVGITMPV